MSDIKIVECPRDAWQGFSKQIPPAEKALYLRLLIEAGFSHLDAVSFVSPRAVPQMADSEEMLQLLGPTLLGSTRGVEIIGIVMNEKGALRAQATEAVTTLGFPYSLSPTFGMRNQRQTPAEALAELRRILAVGLNVTVYLSMAFGNPYGDPWSHEQVVAAAKQIEAMGVTSISLADTVGIADAARISGVCGLVTTEFPNLEIGAHLHGIPAETPGKVRSAVAAGCRRLDSVIGGFGGCPFAQDERIGNLDTITVLETLGQGTGHLNGLRSRAATLAAFAS